MNELKIQIVGALDTDKSSVGELIYDLLKLHGFEVEIVDENFPTENYPVQLRKLKEKTKIKIETETHQVNVVSQNENDTPNDDGQYYEVTSVIWLNNIIWTEGTLLIKKDWRCYDKSGNWLNYNYIKNHIKNVKI